MFAINILLLLYTLSTGFQVWSILARQSCLVIVLMKSQNILSNTYNMYGTIFYNRMSKKVHKYICVPLYIQLRHEEIVLRLIPRLERTAGTKEYARQVSALLEETVEPAHFKLHSLPTENSIPDGRYNPTGFPLWYKEPYKMPLVFLQLVTSFHLFRYRWDCTHYQKIG